MPSPHSFLLGASDAVARLLDSARRFAATPWHIVILGERGTGKTMLAQQIHRWSGLDGAFVRESLANVPDGLAESFLAGHARGAFTGAQRDHRGLFERAHRGTLFLDELGLASTRVQQLLLQYLDDRTVCPVGAERRLPLEVRIVTATNEDPEALVREGRLRADLRDRLGAMRLTMPPLRERRDDIPDLADRVLVREAGELKLAEVPTFAPDVYDCLVMAPWPGNVRELVNVCRFALAKADPGRPIGVGDLPPDFLTDLDDVSRQRATAADQRERIAAALARTGGNKVQAARLLGVSGRTLHRWLAKPTAEAP